MNDNVKTYAAFIAEQMRILKGKGLVAEQTLDEAADDDASKAAAREALKHIRTSASENSDYESALKVLKPHKELHAEVKKHLKNADAHWNAAHEHRKSSMKPMSSADSVKYQIRADRETKQGFQHHRLAVKALRKHINEGIDYEAEETLDEAFSDSKAAAREALKHIRPTASEHSNYESGLKALRPHKELHAAVKTHLAAADQAWKNVHKYMKKRDNSSSTPDPDYGTDKSSAYNQMANDAAEEANHHHAQAVKALRKHIGR